MSDIWSPLQDLEQLLSETLVLAGELEGEGREDHLKVAAILEVSRAEEAGPELSAREGRLGERLGNG